MTKDDKLLIDKIQDKYLIASRDQYLTHSNFLDLNQQSIVKDYLNKNHIPGIFQGGYDLSERNFVYFLPDYLETLDFYDFDYPVSLLKLGFSGGSENKFNNKKLSHRDYLGALMNLGIDRSLLGDIIISSDGAYLFALKHIAAFIEDNLTQVGRQAIEVLINQDPKDIQLEKHYSEITGTVASLRIDNIIKLVFNLSRNQASTYISAKKVFSNHRLVEKLTSKVKPGDVITVRGLGKCQFLSENNKTKKERLHITCRVYK